MKMPWSRAPGTTGLLCLVLLACQGTPAGTGDEPSPGGPRDEPASERPRYVPIQISDDTLISLERSSCYGPCPVYSVSVDARGEVRFVGRDHVVSFGEHEGKINEATLRGLLREFEKLGFFDLEDRYTSPDLCAEYLTDNPTVTLTLRRDGRAKTVSHYHGCRGFEEENALKRLQRSVEGLTGAWRWIGEPGERKSKFQNALDLAKQQRRARE